MVLNIFKTRSLSEKIKATSCYLYLRLNRKQTLAIIAIEESQVDLAGPIYQTWQELPSKHSQIC